MKTHLPHLALMAACAAAMSASAIAQAGQVGAASELKGKRQDPAPSSRFAIGLTTLNEIPGSSEAVAVAAQAQYDAAYSICANVVPVDHVDFSVANLVGPSSGPMDYYMSRGQAFDIKTWQVTLLDGPTHGELVQHPRDPNGFIYRPKEGYLGADQMTFSVEAQGKKFKVIYSVHVGKMAPEYGPCPDYGVKELPNPTKGRGKSSSLNLLELPTDGSVDVEALPPTLSHREREQDSAPTQACLPLRCGLDLASASLPPLKKTTHVTA